MNIYKWQLGFFISLIVFGLYLSFKVVEPYLSILFIAIILAVVFQPLYKKVLKICNQKKWLASTILVLIIILLVLVPVVVFGFLLFNESSILFTNLRLSGTSNGVVETVVTSIQNLMNTYLPYQLNISSYLDVNTYANRTILWLANNSGLFVSGILTGALNVFLLILALFYSFKDGDKMVKKLIEISPLKDTHDQTILDKVHLAVNSVIRGQVIVAVIQGTLAGTGFWLFGVSSPVIWGFIAALASFIPTLGTGLVILPAVLYLFFIGSTTAGIGLIIWGLVVVGLVDNIVGPKLIESGVKIHPFLILLFVLGGIGLFGPIGFIAGPVLLSLLFALFDIYPLMIKQ